jgi:hypothetical protein
MARWRAGALSRPRYLSTTRRPTLPVPETGFRHAVSLGQRRKHIKSEPKGRFGRAEAISIARMAREYTPGGIEEEIPSLFAISFAGKRRF